jgi:hypothetical protein
MKDLRMCLCVAEWSRSHALAHFESEGLGSIPSRGHVYHAARPFGVDKMVPISTR